MSTGTVQVNRLNLAQGPIGEIERHFLYIGAGTTNAGSILNIGVETDLDTALGAEESNLKTQVDAARKNAGQNFEASVLPITGGTTWQEAADFAMENISCEAIVVTDPVDVSTALEAMQAKASEILGKYMRPVFFIACIAGQAEVPIQSWAEYITATDSITDGLACENVMVVPLLWGMDQGTLAGRLCDRSVTVADSPMRVNTGALVGEFSARPVDSGGVAITMADLKALDANRFSVPQWYPDYPGTYWADGNMLDVPAGDYQVVENLRVVQKCMRNVYPLAVARIADRRFNSTPISMAQNKSYFLRPLRAMSKSATIMGSTFPGEIYPPTDESIEIVWMDKYTVQLYLTARPYNCPKSITANIMLDLTTED